jgi:hypothetical protein
MKNPTLPATLATSFLLLVQSNGQLIIPASTADAGASFNGDTMLYAALRLADEFINAGRQGTAGVFHQAAVFPFQLPDLGEVHAPFGSASFTIRLTAKQNTNNTLNVDLYGLAPRTASGVLPAVASESDPGDYFMGPADVSPGVVKLQDNFLVNAIPANTTVTTSLSGSEALAAYLNAAYNNGAGVGSWVFLRLSLDGVPGGVFRYAIGSADASTETNRPFITYQIAVPPTFPVTIAPAEAPETGYILTWESQPGKLYNVRTSVGLDSKIPSWDILSENIAATPPANTFNVNSTDLRRFYAVEEFEAPPLFFAGFEENDDGFTVTTSTGSAWEVGVPNSDNGLSPPNGLVVNSGFNSSARAWATNLGTDDGGFYADSTTTFLRSPVIDLSDASAVGLRFAEAVDFGMADIAEVFVISHEDESVIAGPIHTSSTGDIRTANWALANSGVAIPLPPTAVGRPVRLEWRFTGMTEAFLGWYLDDVTLFAIE